MRISSRRLPFPRGLHLSDFDIQLAQTILDVRQAAIGILAGRARFFQCLLDGCVAIAQYAGHKLAHGPEDDDDDDGKVETRQEKMRAMHAPPDLSGKPLHRLGVLQLYVFFLVFSGRLAGLFDQFSVRSHVPGRGLFSSIFRGCGCLGRLGGLLLCDKASAGWKQQQK
jgi:hypothetical protein